MTERHLSTVPLQHVDEPFHYGSMERNDQRSEEQNFSLAFDQSQNPFYSQLSTVPSNDLDSYQQYVQYYHSQFYNGTPYANSYQPYVYCTVPEELPYVLEAAPAPNSYATDVSDMVQYPTEPLMVSCEAKQEQIDEDEQKQKLGRKRKRVSSKLRHLEVLAEIVEERRSQFGNDAESISTCALCGSCSFANSPSDVTKYMRQHVYYHARGIFTCEICKNFPEAKSSGAVKAHVKKQHGTELAEHPKSVSDNRQQMDEELAALVISCFPGMKHQK